SCYCCPVPQPPRVGHLRTNRRPSVLNRPRSLFVGADLESPSGYALRTRKPVISNHLENEQRFRTPELLAEHGVRRAMNVILQRDGSPFGVLEVGPNSGPVSDIARSRSRAKWRHPSVHAA